MSTTVQRSHLLGSAAGPAREPGSVGSIEPGPATGSAGAGPVVVRRSRRFEGLLTFRGQAQIEGELRGEVLCRGTLRLGPEAVVEGSIDADELIIGGSLRGDATARHRIELCSTARVVGTIRAPRVALADGCRLEGRCDTTPPPVGAPKEARGAPKEANAAPEVP